MSDEVSHGLTHRYDINVKFDTRRDLATFCEFVQLVNKSIDHGRHKLSEFDFSSWEEEEGKFVQNLLMYVDIDTEEASGDDSDA